MNAWDHQRGWSFEIQKDLKWFVRLETGVSPSGTTILAQAKATTQNIWKTRVKTATEAAILMQATDDDLEKLEKFQQEALGSVGLKVGAPPVSVDWACPQCRKCFKNKQAIVGLVVPLNPTMLKLVLQLLLLLLLLLQ